MIFNKAAIVTVAMLLPTWAQAETIPQVSEYQVPVTWQLIAIKNVHQPDDDVSHTPASCTFTLSHHSSLIDSYYEQIRPGNCVN
jgi:hypothetical protein